MLAGGLLLLPLPPPPPTAPTLTLQAVCKHPPEYILVSKQHRLLPQVPMGSAGGGHLLQLQAEQGCPRVVQAVDGCQQALARVTSVRKGHGQLLQLKRGGGQTSACT